MLVMIHTNIQIWTFTHAYPLFSEWTFSAVTGNSNDSFHFNYTRACWKTNYCGLLVRNIRSQLSFICAEKFESLTMHASTQYHTFWDKFVSLQWGAYYLTVNKTPPRRALASMCISSAFIIHQQMLVPGIPRYPWRLQHPCGFWSRLLRSAVTGLHKLAARGNNTLVWAIYDFQYLHTLAPFEKMELKKKRSK